MCHVKLNKKCDFVDIFEFSSTFWNFIRFSASKVFTKLQTIVYYVNIYILPCKLDLCDKKLDFVNIFEFSSTFWNIIHFLPRKFSENCIFYLYIYILPCKLDLCDTWNWTKSVIFVYLFEFPSTFWNLIHFWPIANFQ